MSRTASRATRARFHRFIRLHSLDIALLQREFPAIYALFRFAYENREHLAAGTITQQAAIQEIRRYIPRQSCPFQFASVCEITFKLMNRKGHLVNGARFDKRGLRRIRRAFPDLREATDAFTLFVYLAVWFAKQKAGKAVPSIPEPTTADLLAEAQTLGFCGSEINVICKLVSWKPFKPRVCDY